eukprot:SAG11_NODE_1314_length_5223_cov_2.877244_5_plen_97_part_00
MGVTPLLLFGSGGVWVNCGPLLYHWAEGDGDPRYDESVELSYEAVRHVAESFGFEFVHEGRRECRYASDPRSLMGTAYNCVLFSAVKSAPADDTNQ